MRNNYKYFLHLLNLPNYQKMKKIILIAILSITTNAVSASCMGDEECMNLLEKFGKDSDYLYSEATKSNLALCRKNNTKSSCNEAKKNIFDELDGDSIEDKQSTSEIMADMKASVKEFFGTQYTVIMNKKSEIKIVKEKQSNEASIQVDANNEQIINDGFTAIISCGEQEQISVALCFHSTDLKITKNNRSKIYNIYNFSQAGDTHIDGLHVILPEHFKLKAQNSLDYPVLVVKILNSSGKVIFEDQAGKYGFITVEN